MTQFKKEVTTLRVNKLALAVALGLSLGLAGCGDDQSVSNAVGVPNPNTLMPKGTIQGVLRDSVTNEPIVGAVVDIGIAKATTTETGQFVIENVPATGSIGAAGAGSNSPYQVTIDLRNVKQAAGAAKYPSFSFSTAAVNYSSLNDGSNDAGTSSSNHDTPVTGLTAPLTLSVGKLAAGIKGTVANAMNLKAVGAGYTVKLVSVASVGSVGSAAIGASTTGNSTTGDSATDAKFLNGNVVATTTTDAAGAFVFSGIESLHEFRIEVVNADATEYGVEQVRSPADGQVKTLLAQRADDSSGLDLRTVLVKSTDTLAPRVVKSTPETGTERAPGANVAVTFSFSEPIISNGLTNSLTASTAGNGGLYDLVDVQFEGIKDIAMKASNIPYSLAWDATRTQLTVVIPKVKASAKYKVSIAGAKDILLDNQGYKTDFAFDGFTSANTGEVKFSTNAEGATKPAAPQLAITNEADLDQTNTAVVDWLPVSGAKGYHVYRAKFVNDVMDSKGYEPITRTATDAVADTAQRDAAKAIADAAKIAANTAAQTSAKAGQVANVADVAANTAVKAAVDPTNTLATSTDASAKLTAPAAIDARVASKNADLAEKSDTASTSSISAGLKSSLSTLSSLSALKTVDTANTKVLAVVKTIDDAALPINQNTGAKVASLAKAANDAVRQINQDIMMAAKVAAAVNDIVVATAKVAAVGVPTFAAVNVAQTAQTAAQTAVNVAQTAVDVAQTAVDAAQAAVNADPNNAAKKAALTATQSSLAVKKAEFSAKDFALSNAKEAVVNAEKAAKKYIDDQVKEANAAMDVAKATAKEAQEASTAANEAKTAALKAKTDADKAKTDADTAKTAADTAKTAAEGKKTAADTKLATAKTALTKANTDLATAKSDLEKADTAVEAADAALDLQKALDAVDKAKAAADTARTAANTAATKATEADVAADEAADEAAKAAETVTAATKAATAATESAAKATTATAAIAAAVTAADKALDDFDTATANAKPSEIKASVLAARDLSKAKIAAALAKADAASKIMSATDVDTHSKAAVAAAKAANDKAIMVAAVAKTIAEQAAAAQTAVAAAQLQVANALTTANTNNTNADKAWKDAVAAETKAKDAVKAQEDKLTAAQTLVTTTTATETAAQTTSTNADVALAADPNNAAKKAAADSAKTVLNTATLAKNSAISAAAVLAASQPNLLAKLNYIVAAKVKAEGDAKGDAQTAAQTAKEAKDAKDAADAALTAANTAKAAAATALTDANTAQTATAKLLASMTLADTSIKKAVADYKAATKATTDAKDASVAAADAADAAVAAAENKTVKDKELATAVKEKAAADKALADAQGVIDSDGGYVANANMDQYLTQNTSFVQGSEGVPAKSLPFAEGIRKVTYKYKVRAVSEDNVESVDGNEVEAKDNTQPKVSSFTMNTASNVITVVFTEPMNEIDFKKQANYVLSAPAGVTVPAVSNAMFKIDSKTVVLSYASNIPAGSTVTVTGLKDLAGNAMSEVGNTATVDKVTSSIAGFIGSTQVTVFFSAEMDKASAETAANYALPTGPALLDANGVVYNSGNNSVTLTYVSAIPAGVTLTVSGVKDANGTVVESNTKQFN